MVLCAEAETVWVSFQDQKTMTPLLETLASKSSLLWKNLKNFIDLSRETGALQQDVVTGYTEGKQQNWLYQYHICLLSRS